MPHDIASVFKAYDIRGLSPGALDHAFALRLGHCLAKEWNPKRVLVGRDMRETSDDLERGLIEGLTSQGVHVTRIGRCSTPMFNVSVGLGNGTYDLGVMVTASHNPAEYNGFKMVTGDVYPIGQGSGMEKLRERFEHSTFDIRHSTFGSVTDDPHALAAYLDRIAAIVDPASVPTTTIAVDAGNGMAGAILPALQERLPQITMLPLYWEPDGSFPHHEANPLKTETLHDLSALVTKGRCAFGVAFDGDADRVGFVDEQGTSIPGDILTALFARELLKVHPGALVGYDLRSSWTTEEVIRAAGGHPEQTRVGHAFIKRQMRERGGVFAGELSMHFYFGDLWSVESTDLCLLLMLKIVGLSGQPLSTLWRPLVQYHKTEEINSEVSNREEVLKRIEDAYASRASNITRIDGVRMEFGVASDGTKGADAWWFSVRPSNTEPLMRLIVEAVSEHVMMEKRDELLKLIRE
jgi:phosphomannomutase